MCCYGYPYAPIILLSSLRFVLSVRVIVAADCGDTLALSLQRVASIGYPVALTYLVFTENGRAGIYWYEGAGSDHIMGRWNNDIVTAPGPYSFVYDLSLLLIAYHF